MSGRSALRFRRGATSFRAHEGKPTSTRGNRRTAGARGRMYDSEAEALYSWVVEGMLRDGTITGWRPQVTLPCVANGIKICSRRIDFWLDFPDGHVELVEVKGYREEAFAVRQKALEATWLFEHREATYVEIDAGTLGRARAGR